MSQFSSSVYSSARELTTAMGLQDLIPGAILDDKIFEPCGYSLNAIVKASQQSFLTLVHATSCIHSLSFVTVRMDTCGEHSIVYGYIGANSAKLCRFEEQVCLMLSMPPLPPFTGRHLFHSPRDSTARVLLCQLRDQPRAGQLRPSHRHGDAAVPPRSLYPLPLCQQGGCGPSMSNSQVNDFSRTKHFVCSVCMG